MNLEEFATEFQEEVLRSAEAVEGGEFVENKFTEIVLSWLAELGECFTPEVTNLKRPGIKLNAWDLQDEGGLDLFVASFDGARAFYKLPKGELLDSLGRCRRFLERSLKGLYRDLEESEPGYEPAQTIFAQGRQIAKVRTFLLTNGVVSPEPVPDATVEGIPVTHHIWDIERLFQVSEGRRGPEEILIGEHDLAGGLPCVILPAENEVYRSYVGVIPGPVLATLYRNWGQRLLERNLRSYLQTRTKINKEMLDTLRKKPRMFFAYNNGISTTAAEADVTRGGDGSTTVRALRDFQIVNGGQTTATLAEAERDGVDLGGVFVQFKLTVLNDPANVDEAVASIAKYANSQNKVSLSDFTSNNPYHVELEKLSRTTLVPNPDQRGKATTKWYYERVRAAYLNDIRAQPTPSKKREFRGEYPVQQKITKTELAKYEMSWRQYPHVVSLGAEKNYLRFMDMVMTEKWPMPTEQEYERLVAKAILFRACDGIVRKGGYQGYKANIVTYSIAYLSHLTESMLDLDAIWTSQSLPEPVEVALARTAGTVRDHITTPPKEGMNVTEWCKKEDCWNQLKARGVPDLPQLGSVLWKEPSVRTAAAPSAPSESNPSSDGGDDLTELLELPKEEWFGLAAWGKQTGFLNGWERKFAFGIGRLVARKLKPSLKQAQFAKRVLAKAMEKGYRVGSTPSGHSDLAVVDS